MKTQTIEMKVTSIALNTFGVDADGSDGERASVSLQAADGNYITIEVPIAEAPKLNYKMRVTVEHVGE